MEISASRVRNAVLAGSYLYLTLPAVIFFLGWCRWYIGIPAALAAAVSLLLCLKEHSGGGEARFRLDAGQLVRAAAAAALVLVWVFLSGIGGYVWQNSDHLVRNEIFILLVEGKWPLAAELEGAGLRGLVYYIGFWLPAAVVGKIFGIRAGWAAQYAWAAAGILLMYALVCIWRRKLSVWPLALIIFFSGLDAVGMLVCDPSGFQVFGDASIDGWPGAYQFSSVTTQLFWVFNQAVPAWLLSALVFLGEKPRNMVFLSATAVLTSTLPFAGIVPFVCYFMVSRAEWGTGRTQVRQVVRDCWKNWGSFQNAAGGGAVFVVCAAYVSGNDAVRGGFHAVPDLNPGQAALLLAGGVLLAAGVFWGLAALALRGWGARLKKLALVLLVLAALARCMHTPGWRTPIHYLAFLTFFYAVDAGVFLAVLFPSVEDRKLFALAAVWLYVIPMIIVGGSCDFCMRASIPGLFLIMLWCIRAFDTWGNRYGKALLLALLCIGAVTPFHEIKRTCINSCRPYENMAAEEEDIYRISNFSGSVRGFFWEYIAGPVD